jgi:hypothetical protein
MSARAVSAPIAHHQVMSELRDNAMTPNTPDLITTTGRQEDLEAPLRCP